MYVVNYDLSCFEKLRHNVLNILENVTLYIYRLLITCWYDVTEKPLADFRIRLKLLLVKHFLVDEGLHLPAGFHSTNIDTLVWYETSTENHMSGSEWLH